MNPNHALLPDWMFRLVHRDSQGPASTLLNSRVEVYPPQVWPSSFSWRGRLQRWWQASAPWRPAPSRPVNRLAVVKDEFLFTLSDLPGQSPMLLSERVARARSLRELWHLRLPVYGELALAFSQAEAERRLGRLNRHFPTRTPRPAAAAH